MKKTIFLAILAAVIGLSAGCHETGTTKVEKASTAESPYLTAEEMTDTGFEYSGAYPDIGMQRWQYTEEQNGTTYKTHIYVYLVGIAASDAEAEELATDYLDSMETGSFSGQAIGDRCWSRDKYTDKSLLVIKDNVVVYFSANKTILFSDTLVAKQMELESLFSEVFYPPSETDWEEIERIMETEEYKTVQAEYQKALEDNGLNEYGILSDKCGIPEVDVELIEEVAGRVVENIGQGSWAPDKEIADLPELEADTAPVPGVEALVPTNEEMAGFQFCGRYGNYEWYYTDTDGNRSTISMDISVVSSPDQARMLARFNAKFFSAVLYPGAPGGGTVGDECWSITDSRGGGLRFVKDNAVVYITCRAIDGQEFDPALLEEVAHILVQKIEMRNWSPLEVITLNYRPKVAEEAGVVPNVDASLLSETEMPEFTLKRTISPLNAGIHCDSRVMEEVFQQGKRQIWLSESGQKIEVEFFVAPTNSLAGQFAGELRSSRFNLTKQGLLLGGNIGDICWSSEDRSFPYPYPGVLFVQENAVVLVSTERYVDTPVDLSLIDDIATRISQKIDSFKSSG